MGKMKCNICGNIFDEDSLQISKLNPCPIDDCSGLRLIKVECKTDKENYSDLLSLAYEMFEQLKLMDYENKAKETYDEFEEELSKFNELKLK